MLNITIDRILYEKMVVKIALQKSRQNRGNGTALYTSEEEQKMGLVALNSESGSQALYNMNKPFLLIPLAFNVL